MTGIYYIIYNMHCFIDEDLQIGFTTRLRLMKLLNDGDISDRQVKVFFKAVRSFYQRSVEYAIANLPHGDEVLHNSRFLNYEKNYESTFTQVEYFLSRYNTFICNIKFIIRLYFSDILQFFPSQLLLM